MSYLKKTGYFLKETTILLTCFDRYINFYYKDDISIYINTVFVLKNFVCRKNTGLFPESKMKR